MSKIIDADEKQQRKLAYEIALKNVEKKGSAPIIEIW